MGTEDAVDSSPLTRAVRTVFIGTATRFVAGSIGALVVAIILGPESRGVLAVLMTLSGLLGVVVSLGMNASLTYRLGQCTWSPAQALAVVVVQVSGTAIVGLLSWATGALGYLLDVAGYSSITPSVLIVGMLASLLVSLVGGALTGLKRFRALAALGALPPVVNLAVFILAMVLGANPLLAAMWSWAGSTFMVGCAGLAPVVRVAHWRLQAPDRVRNALSYGVRSMLAVLVNTANLRLDVLLLAAFGSAAQVGYYAFAVQISEIGWVMSAPVGIVLFPSVAGGREFGDGSISGRLARTTGAAVVLASGAIAAIGTVAILAFLDPYRGSILLLWLLLPGVGAFALAQVVGNDLYGRGKPTSLVVAAVLALIATAAGNLVAIPFWGAAGCALVSSLAYGVYAAALTRSFCTLLSRPVSDVLPVARADWADAVSVMRASLAIRHT
jgi:O-antigen/teichoic acid export membrane protein